MAEFARETTTPSRSSQILKGVLIFIGFIILEFIVLLKMTVGRAFLSDAEPFSRIKITAILAIIAIPYLYFTVITFLKQKKRKG